MFVCFKFFFNGSRRIIDPGEAVGEGSRNTFTICLFIIGHLHLIFTHSVNLDLSLSLELLGCEVAVAGDPLNRPEQ